jgi:hypothetical protein
MDLNLLLGILAIWYGLYMLYVRATSPGKLLKLEAMKKHWGERTGLIVHVVGYTVVPIIVGLVLIMSSLLARGAGSQ